MDFSTEIKDLFLKNRRYKGKFQYTVPSPSAYPYQWLWDSCFHAIVLSYFNLTDAKKEILSLVSNQFEDGMIPHIIYWRNLTHSKFLKINWGKKGTSTITQPPMIAYAVWQIFEKDGDKDFLEGVYFHLYNYYLYLLKKRDPNMDHLLGIINPDESGEDNSPRFDEPLGLSPNQTLEENIKRRLQLVKQNIECNFDLSFCMKNFFWVKDVPFNSIMIENLDILAKIAKKLNHPTDASFFKNEADKISWAMRRLMLEDGIFWSIYGDDNKKIKVKTWSIFSPLFAKILTPKEASKLVQNNLCVDVKFWAKYPLPTVSLEESSFDPNDFWRGPAWMASNWFVYKGLRNYGFDKEAEKIKKSSQNMLQISGFRERFNPLNGEGLGAKNFTWGGLVLDMV